jgi:hypothetical protein
MRMGWTNLEAVRFFGTDVEPYATVILMRGYAARCSFYTSPSFAASFNPFEASLRLNAVLFSGPPLCRPRAHVIFVKTLEPRVNGTIGFRS